ncbi:ABC-type transport system involved in multi-copper enzyme maturation, permease component [Candidatus Methanoperedens nitroreducens]|uniref:ABC-type transport system involved in multi-copper enzyme maturation, permease component n=1 Tax=Candidatus Methanoperedens nitratireducens TaxID=1392998 RepID=A0A062V344_9EURY|nr:ABC transporter permease [Candidatus Methanoperedens nitroreducens]KCZ71023.1 ABC-type transport system involved in multi-copper enzyme maturation, permease component [Candidatus Methanoperedens nitroreducens]MDJ1421606.1 ABC transporter permease [Candidatus Methanoperedens sp.]
MKRNVENVFVVAQKEFADSIWSPRFYLILGIFMIALLVNGYQAGQNISGMSGRFFAGLSPLTMGFMGFASQMSLLGPLIAIVLGFDAIVKERKSGSLNVLLTHPVYRDQVITGKLIGMMVTLGLVVVIAVGASVGVMLGVSGITVSVELISRIAVFMMLAFLFMLGYLALSVAASTFTKESSDSLIYSIAVWLVLGLLLGMVAYTAAGIITGQQRMFEVSSDDPSSMEKMEKRNKIARNIMSLSPSTHFTELINGPQISGGYVVTSAGGAGERPSEMRGLFDTGFTLGHWVEQNWVNLVVLIVTPVILLLVSYMAFMRQDITL